MHVCSKMDMYFDVICLTGHTIAVAYSDVCHLPGSKLAVAVLCAVLRTASNIA
jgi:hypothetical protein